MDPSTNFALIQSIIVWTLLGFLLTWMVIFAVLAIRSHTRETFAHGGSSTQPQLFARISSILPKFHIATVQPAETVNAESTLPSEVAIRS